jgi:hypothetical protein
MSLLRRILKEEESPDRYLKLLSRRYFDYQIEEGEQTFEQAEKYFSKAQVEQFLENRREDDISYVEPLYNYLKKNYKSEYNKYIHKLD